nr:uncharacterized protein LOC109416319 isoform X2 [Aedes albopictus]
MAQRNMTDLFFMLRNNLLYSRNVYSDTPEQPQSIPQHRRWLNKNPFCTYAATSQSAECCPPESMRSSARYQRNHTQMQVPRNGKFLATDRKKRYEDWEVRPRR